MESNIFHKIENSKSVDFGNVLSQSFELYQKVFKEGIIHTLISLIVIVPFLLFVYIPILPWYIDAITHAGDPYYYGNEPFSDFAPIWIFAYVVLIFILSFLMQVFNMAIYAHFLLVVKRADTGSSQEVGGYFSFLKEHFGKILILSLASFGIVTLATLLCLLPVFYVIVPITLILPILVFNQKLSASEIIKAAFKLGNKHWGIVFGLIIVASILASLGAIVCYIGLIATAFFTYIVLYYFYKDSVGFDDITT
jgi:hypothetical protein